MKKYDPRGAGAAAFIIPGRSPAPSGPLNIPSLIELFVAFDWLCNLYALQGGEQHLEIAQKWLLAEAGRDARETVTERKPRRTSSSSRSPWSPSPG